MPKNNILPRDIPARSNPPHASYKYIAIIFVVLAFLLVLGVTYLALSKVTITLSASDSKIEHSFNLTITETAISSTSTDIVVKGQIFSTSQEVEQQFFVESDKQIEAKAEGEVVLHNDRNVSQTLVATTRLLTPDGVLFRLKDKVTVPAKSTKIANVSADEKGVKGNIGPNQFTIPGLSDDLQKLVYAKSQKPMFGGVRKIGILTESDIEKAEVDLQKNAMDKIITEFINGLDNKDLILVGSKNQVTEVKNDKELGEEVDSFGLSGIVQIDAVFSDRQKILETAKQELKKSQDEKGDFVNVDPSSLKYELMEIDIEKKQAIIQVKITGLITIDPEKDIFDKNLLVGFTEEDLKLYFSQFESIKEVGIEFSPFWVKKVPILRDHIIIKVK